MLTTNSRRGKPQSKMPAILVLLLTAMVCVLMLGLMLFPIPTDNKDVLVFMAGQITPAWMVALGYYYSSNSGSKNKDELLAASVPIQRQDDQ